MNYITFAVLFASITAWKNGQFITMENISLSARLTPQRNARQGKCAKRGEHEARAREMSGQPFPAEVKRYFPSFIKICWLRLIINKSNNEAEGNNYHEISRSSCSFFMRQNFGLINDPLLCYLKPPACTG
ncbi:hypothetical protein L2X78_12130 [Enterobacter mori]|uniref:hypothetical protein n=1 Tax=Enterobacter mori TaxID=539813 RepID=UPI001EE3E0C6|nr:hypothetical protein [Enterobacter mori]MCG5128326.1 hypothetical protein [Enterobacter mori]